jgi:uncharacterized membrane protein HdeD (DUF308 family)
MTILILEKMQFPPSLPYYAAAAATAIAGILHLVLAANSISRRASLSTIFFIISGILQIFWAWPMTRRWGRMWYYVGIDRTIILIVMYFVTRAPTPITGGRALSVNTPGIASEVFQFIYIGITVYILARQKGLTTEQKEQLR